MASKLASSFFEEDEPHKLVKRIMWKKYLQAFIAKTQQAKTSKSTGYNSIICDVFAGPGIIGDKWNEDIDSYGSPLIALRVVFDCFINLNHLANKFNQTEACPYLPENSRHVGDNYRVKLFFNENDDVNYHKLINNVYHMFRCYDIDVDTNGISSGRVLFGSKENNISVCCQVTHGAFEAFTSPDLSQYDRMVTFIDPFGFSQIPMAKVAEFAGENREVFINLMSSFMNRFFEAKTAVIAKVFGFETSHLVNLHSEAEGDRIKFIVETYAESLRLRSRSGFPVLTFEMRNIKNIRLYHLVFMSKHIEGVKAMKESMNKGSQNSDEMTLSDYNILRKSIPLNLGNLQNPNDVAKCIFNQFHGQTVSLVDIEDFIWLETPFVFRKKPLKRLQNYGLITNVVDAVTGEKPMRRGTFPETTEAGSASNWNITFASTNYGTQELGAISENIPLNPENPDDIAKCIFNKFQGQTVSLLDIENFVRQKTPFVFRKEPLKILQKDGRITNVVDAATGENPMRKGTFPEKTKAGLESIWRITFSNKE